MELLLAERPRAVSKGQIFERLWPNTFVSETNLASLVCEIRSAIGEDARSATLVRTVRGFGYAFGGEVTDSGGAPAEASPELCYRLTWRNREIELREGENVLGRTHDAVVWIDSPTVSRRHARIVVARGRATVEDLGSKNGTKVNGERVDSAALSDGDRIELGSVSMTFRAFSAEPSTVTLRTEE
jgi:hypothetical protein